MGIHSIKLRVSVHATEDEERVRKALLEAIPEELRSTIRINREEYTGHYGNPILVLTIEINNPKLAEEIFSYILKRLATTDRNLLLDSLEERVDKNGTLYFRLSKQEAYEGRLTVYEADDVIKVNVGYEGRRRKALEEYRRKLEDGD
jgi:RNA binding exosome subunit